MQPEDLPPDACCGGRPPTCCGISVMSGSSIGHRASPSPDITMENPDCTMHESMQQCARPPGHAACSIRTCALLMQACKRGKRKAIAGPVLDPLEQTLVERKVGHSA